MISLPTIKRWDVQPFGADILHFLFVIFTAGKIVVTATDYIITNNSLSSYHLSTCSMRGDIFNK